MRYKALKYVSEQLSPSNRLLLFDNFHFRSFSGQKQGSCRQFWSFLVIFLPEVRVLFKLFRKLVPNLEKTNNSTHAYVFLIDLRLSTLLYHLRPRSETALIPKLFDQDYSANSSVQITVYQLLRFLNRAFQGFRYRRFRI